MQAATVEIAELMDRLRSGSKEAAGQLVALFYPELRRLARLHMQREAPGHSWQPTVLVNQLYLELIKIRALRRDDGADAQNDRQAFFGLAAHLMRRLLIHHSRPLYRKAQKVGLTDAELGPLSGTEALTEVEDLLERLQKLDSRLRAVVELRAFEGKTAEEAAAAMNCSLRTVHKYWSFAKRWLASEMGACFAP